MTITNYNSIWICFFLLIPQIVFSITTKSLPSFLSLPPNIQYYSPNNSSTELRCEVWPKSAKIKFVVSSKKWGIPQDPTKTLTISDLDASITESEKGVLKITNNNHFTQIQEQDIHCMASTDFATVLSRPFRISRAVMSDFGGRSNTLNTNKLSFLQGNVAIIDCWPPESHPKADVTFLFNDKEIKEEGRYRIVHWSEGKRVSLLIQSVEEKDSGSYRCSATNRVIRKTKFSSEINQLEVKVPVKTVSPVILVPISGRTGGAQQITARQGSNVTLFCVMGGAPPPNVRTYSNENSKSDPRFNSNNPFGILDITNVQLSDSATYMCSDQFIVSSVVFKVIEPLFIKTRPENVVLDDAKGEAAFSCIPSKPSIAVQWLFNGRPMVNTYNSTTFVVSDVTASSLGLYQCIVQDKDEWASAAATLSTKSISLISQHDTIQNIRVPTSNDIDNEGKVLKGPDATRIFDNLAVFLTWKLNQNDLGAVSYYVIEISHRTDDNTWSVPVTVQERINTTFFYITNTYVAPQRTYRFRVHAFFVSGHVVTSIWSSLVKFMDMGIIAPIIKQLSVQAPDNVIVTWSYSDSKWQVSTFRVLYRQIHVNATETSKKHSTYFHKDVNYPSNNVTLEKLVPGSSYQVVVYGRYENENVKTSTKFSEPQIIAIPIVETKNLETTKGPNKFLTGLWDSWNSNKVLYGSLFALTGLMLLIMFLLLLLCLCRQRRFRTNKGMGSTNTFPYNYKEVSKTSSAVNNNSSTLQIPGRIPQHSSQLALQQFQQNNGSLDRRNTDTSSQIYRAGSVQAMETASLVTDLYGHNYMHGMPVNHMQHPYQGFSTLQPQNYPNSHSRSVPQYQHYLNQQQQQQHHAQLGSLLRENPTGDSNRDSITDQSIEMATRNMNPNQMRQYMGYYDQRQGAMSPQMMLMMLGSQQSLANSGQYKRSNSQNYSIQSVETPIALNPNGHPIYQMDQVLVDSVGRPLSPQYHYMQQQQNHPQHHQQQHQSHHQQQQHQSHQQQNSHMGQMHPSMMDMYNQPHAFSRPMVAEYQQSLNRQQYRRSDNESSNPETGYSYLPMTHGQEMVSSSRQHTLNSLPEQPIDNNNHDHHDSPGPIIATNSNNNNNNNSSSSRHHHRRKTRSRQANHPEPSSLERSQVINNHNDIPPMLAPRSKLPYSEHQGIHRLSAHDMNTIDSHENAMNDCNSESNTAGAVSDNFDPPLQYSGHYDTNESKYRMDCNMDMNDNEATPSNSLLIDNLPRVRDVSEYGIPLNNNNHNMKQAPVPPLKTNNRHNPVPSNSYGLECNPEYYSSATSSDRSGPSPPPKYAPGVVLPARPDEIYMRDQREGMYYHGDTHC